MSSNKELMQRRSQWRGTYDGTLAENPYLPDIISVDDAQD